MHKVRIERHHSKWHVPSGTGPFLRCYIEAVVHEDCKDMVGLSCLTRQGCAPYDAITAMYEKNNCANDCMFNDSV